MPLRVIFLGNSGSEFSNRHFQALQRVPCTIAGVVDSPPDLQKTTNPAGSREDSFAAHARRLGIPLFEPARPNRPEFARQIAELRPDVLLAAGYTQILKPTLLSLPRLLAANFHASLLPAYRGMHPVLWCLRNGERWSGLTVHVMDRGIDTGDILYQVRVHTRQADSVSSLYGRIMDRSEPLVGRLVDDLSKNRLPRRIQPGAGASYYPALQEGDFRLDWRWEAARIGRWIALSPGKCFVDVSIARVRPARRGPTAGCALLRMFILEARPSGQTPSLPPGTIQWLGRRVAIISTGEGSLRLERVCLEPGKPLAFAEACRLLGLQRGDYLG